MQKKYFLIFLILLIFISFYCVNAKSYSIPKANIDISVNDDASLLINESITFNFNGKFSYAYRDIYYDKEIIEDIKVFEIMNNQLIPINSYPNIISSNTLRINWQYQALNEQKVIFQAFNIPKNQWVELRVAFPPYTIKDSTYSQKFNSNSLQNIITEEEHYKNTNYFVASKPLRAFIFLSPLLSVLLIFFIFYLIWGKEPNVKGQYNAIYERDIPFDYSPAIVGALIHHNSKKPNAKDFVASILYLCLKGNLKLEVIRKKKFLGVFGSDTDYKITKTNKSTTSLAKHEKKLIEILDKYMKNDSITFNEFRKNAQYNAWTFRSNFESWQDQTKKEAESMNFFSKFNASNYYSIICFFFIVVGILSLAILNNDINIFSFALAGFFGFFLNYAILPGALPSRTLIGAIHYNKWVNLKKYLKNFSRMKHYPPASIVVWDNYLVYAIALGVADKVQEVMKLVVPNSTQNSALFVGTVNYHSFNTYNFVSSMNTFSSSFASSSGTSGSGGFGGGGGGAW